MTDFTKKVFAALTTGIVLSAVISVLVQQYPEFALIGILLFAVGLIVAVHEAYSWYNSSEIDRVIPFVLGAVNAVFGLAIAVGTTELLIWMLFAAAVVDAFFGALARFGVKGS